MERHPPTPVCRSFTVCRQILQDKLTGEFVLIGPTHQIYSFTYPTVANLSVFARCTSVQGVYRLEIQLQDLEGNAIWGQKFDPPLDLNDPLAVGTLNLQNLGIFIPKPGKYDLVLLANGEEIVRDVFFALFHAPPQVAESS
jgi:hypothetical protein